MRCRGTGVVETVKSDEIGRHIAKIVCDGAAVLHGFVRRASLLGEVESRSRVTGRKLDLGKVPRDRRGRPFEIERLVMGQCIGVKSFRSLDITTSQTRGSEVAQHERLHPAVIEQSRNGERHLEKGLALAGAA